MRAREICVPEVSSCLPFGFPSFCSRTTRQRRRIGCGDVVSLFPVVVFECTKTLLFCACKGVTRMTNQLLTTTNDMTAIKDYVPLGNRYSAAWLEHSTRVAQRQNVIQIYITSSGAIFGIFFSSAQNNLNCAIFLLVGVTILTWVSSVFLWLHHRVMQNLFNFMKDCERQTAEIIRHC